MSPNLGVGEPVVPEELQGEEPEDEPEQDLPGT